MRLPETKPFHEMGNVAELNHYSYEMLLRRREAKKEAVKREQLEAGNSMRKILEMEASHTKK